MTQLTQKQLKGHLSEDAANAFLAALPEYVRVRIEADAHERGFPVWAILEAAVSNYLDADATSFTDFDPEFQIPRTLL
jgi:hypothetical protein